MRYLAFICRPCLASIRKQQGQQALLRTAVLSSWGTTTSPVTTTRFRAANFTVSHAAFSKRGEASESEGSATCPPTDSGALSKTAQGDDTPSLHTKPPNPTRIEAVEAADRAAYEEMERALKATHEANAGQRTPGQASWDEEDDTGVVPGADGLDKGHGNIEADDLRDPDVVWDETEAFFFSGPQGPAIWTEEIRGEDTGARGTWEDLSAALSAAKAAFADSSTALSNCKTAEEYFRTIYADPDLAASRGICENGLVVKWTAWFRSRTPARDLAPGPEGMRFPPRLEDMNYPTMWEWARRIESMKQQWRRLSALSRDSRWPELITKCLIYDPRKLPLLLQAIIDKGIARPYMLQAVIRLLSFQVQHYKEQDQKNFSESVALSLLHTLYNTPQGSVELTQKTVFRIMKFASAQTVSDLYVALKDYGWRPTRDTKMQFASRLAKEAEYRLQGLDLLGEMVRDDNLDINSVEGAALCTSLLAIQNHGSVAPDRNTSRASPSPEVAQHVYETVLSLGLSPNLINYTAIIQALCESRQLSKAWDVFRLMCTHGIDPDAQALLVLHWGSKICSDYNSAIQVIQLADQLGLHHPFLWNDVIHMIHSEADKQATRQQSLSDPNVLPVYAPMRFVYDRFFKDWPLERFLMAESKRRSGEEAVAGADKWLWDHVRPVLAALARLSPRKHLMPEPDTLFIMLVGYIRGFRNPTQLESFYRHIVTLLKGGDPLVLQLLKSHGAKLHNAIILALCEHKSMMRPAMNILSHMLRDAVEARLVTEAGREDTVPRHPEPDIRTWGIILHALMKHGRTNQAEEFLDVMRQHGIPPRMSNYNQLLSGYSHANQMVMARNAMERAQTAGLVPDEFTMRIFSRMEDSEEAQELMEMAEEMVRQREALKRDRSSALGRIYSSDASSLDHVDVSTAAAAVAEARHDDGVQADGDASANASQDKPQADDATLREYQQLETGVVRSIKALRAAMRRENKKEQRRIKATAEKDQEGGINVSVAEQRDPGGVVIEKDGKGTMVPEEYDIV